MFLFGAVILLLKVTESGSNFLDIDDIRLVNGSGPFGGRVEVSVNGIWGTVCDDSFDMNDASVMCRMMNLTASTFVSGAWFGPGTGPIFSQEFECNGNEAHLRDCPFVSNVQCTNERDVGIICSECGAIEIANGHAASISANGTILTVNCDNRFKSTGIKTSICENGVWNNPSITCPLYITDIRLTNGIGLYDGRIELLVNDTWGTVCFSTFSWDEANAICNILFGTTSYRTFHSAGPSYYGEKTGPIYIDNLDCDGTETDINKCSYSTDVSCSDHTRDAAVACNIHPLNITGTRLVNGTGPYDGRMEIYVDGHWGTICNREIDIYDAQTICNTHNASLAAYFNTTVYGEGSGPVLLDYIWCQPEYPLNIRDIRLASGYRPTEGRVEILVNETWGTVCNTNFDSRDAAVICQMFGLQYRTYYINAIHRYGKGSGPIYLNMLECNGSEDHINKCSYELANHCTHYDDIGVTCTGYQLNITDIRLAGTNGPYHGRIELEVNGTWGTVCDGSFGCNDARVFCRMLGLAYHSEFYNAHYGEGSGPIYIDRLLCTGWESHINDCEHVVNNYYNCDHGDDASVMCYGPQLNIIEARLANGTSAYEGRAEIKVGDEWGTICDENFNILAADLFCDMFGLRAAQVFTDALYGEGSGPIFIDQLFCEDDDLRLDSCKYLFLNECSHERDVSVVCNECGQPDISFWDAGYFSYNGSSLYADCSFYKTYVGTLKLTCNNDTRTWVTEGECQEYSYPLDVTNIRLVGGPSPSAGRVEIQSLNTWGTVCSHSFGQTEANMICNMIGYRNAAAYHTGTNYGTGSGPIFVDDLVCPENATELNDCTYNTNDNCNHDDDISVVCTDCGDPTPFNGIINSTLTNVGATVQVTCEKDHTLIGDAVITCLMNGTWSDTPTCALIECEDPTPENGFSNATTTVNGTHVYIECDEGFDLDGDDLVVCQENETWTDDPVCQIKDCGFPSTPNAYVTLINNKTTYGETVLVSCQTGYNLIGNPTVSCLSNDSWEMMPSCKIVDCRDPTPSKGSANRNETTYGTVVEISCNPGYNITGNSTIICKEDGSWSSTPVCDATDCGFLSVPNGDVDNSQGRSIGSVATITCNKGYNLNGTSSATCIATDDVASWNYSATCELHFCDDPTPQNGLISKTDGSEPFVFENYVEIECNVGYEISGDSVITCGDGGVWSDTPSCVILDCEPLNAPLDGSMDDSQGTIYNTEITFSCNDGFLLVGDQNTLCGETGDWSNEAPICIAKSDFDGSCINEDYCLLAGSRCMNFVCTCITGIYDIRTRQCDTMPLIPFGEEEGDTSISDRTICSPKISFEPGFPVFDEMHTELYVCKQGFVSVTAPFTNPTPPTNGDDLVNFGQHRTILAPFYGPIDRKTSGPVMFRSYDILNSNRKMEEDADLISYIENIVTKFGDLTSFEASFILVATWDKARAIGSGYDQTKPSTFQLILTSDGKYTYAFYIYGNGMMEWINNLSTNPNVWVGYTVDSLTNTHPYSFTDAALQLDSQPSIVSSENDVAGLIFKPLNSQGSQHNNHAVDCIKWYNENYKEKKRLDYIASLTPECPCDIRLSRFDPWFWRIGLYRWRYDLKYKCIDMLHVGNFGHYGKSCCYDLRTWLWIYERPLAGSFQLYNSRHPADHIKKDVQPKTDCCVFSKYCNLYYELRPTGSCYRTSPYNFGTFWGDPHFSTLDGMNFTFNGLGEYTLLHIHTDNCSFDLQARTERALKDDGNLSHATVFTAFAAKDSSNSSVHVERNKKRTGINLYGNDVDLTDHYNSNTDETDPFIWLSRDEHLTISKRNDSVDVFFPACDISLKISIAVEMLTLTTYVPDNLKNQTKGLLGKYNGDASDDFTMPNGTVLKANLTEREIFAYGKTWAIDPNNSAFVYDVGKSHFDFHNDSYVPRFLDEADPERRAKAVEVCKGSENIECIFDFVSTENPDVAEKTKHIKRQAEADKIEIEESVPKLEGCSTVNVTKGQHASCKFNVEDGDTIEIISSNNVSVDTDQLSSMITFVPETDQPVSIRVAASNKNGRYSPAFVVSILLCTGCSGHGTCTNVSRIDPRQNEYFRYSTCDCETEYEGIDCERVFDGCAAKPCSLDRNCTTLTAEQQKTYNRSYLCDPCPDGFNEDGDGECIDIDECATSNGNCDQNCINTDGSFECTYKGGYRVNRKDKLTCKDINECDEALHSCDHICNNTEGGYTCQCYAGYRFNTTSWSCVQISEGSCNDDNKIKCSNTHGCTTEEDNAPVCFCKDGYELDETRTNCKDIDECRRGVCPQNCINTNGSFQCICFTGYHLEGVATCTECDKLHWGENCEQRCVCTGRGADRCDPVKGCICEAGWYGDTCNDDINECELEAQACNDPRKKCVNSLGSYTCECRSGFYITDQGGCEDTDECTDPQLYNCTQECLNTIGSYSCGCRVGYTKVNEWSCEDIDECKLGTSNCEQRCVNNEGQFSCFCHFGYSINDDRRTCSKLSDPCLTMHNLTCAHFCLLEIDNAVCGCKSGFMLDADNVTCTDINECTNDDENKCDGEATCINTEGSYICKCQDGNQLENDGRTCSECDNYHYGRNCMQTCSCLNGICDKKTGCVCDPGWAGVHCDTDIDECSTEQVTCPIGNSVCVNVLGSAICSCKTGYRNNIGVCQDIDECDDVTKNDCDQICTNTEGSYTCSCQHGFILNGKCKDIDECAGSHDCDQICENTVGSYRCSCEEGFRLSLSNRKSCLPQYECNEEQKTSTICPEHSICVVQNGAVSCPCLKGYREEAGACKDIDECEANLDPCSHTCSNTKGGFVCSCDVGFFLLEDKVTCQECAVWKYGDNCDTDCSCNQQNAETCDSITGTCACKSGWSGLTCDSDVDECMDNTICPNNSVCHNTNGSHNCICRKGYFKTGSRTCEVCDFRHFGDNCLGDCTCNFENTEDCDHKTGTCLCKQGWSGDECMDDVNECTDNPKTCDEIPNSTCNNTFGSYICYCNLGFTDINNTCEDIDECSEQKACCEHYCNNTIGSYKCLCDTGFQLSIDGKTCEYIPTTTAKPDSAIQIEAVVIIEIEIPTDTNLNNASVYMSFENKLVETLHVYFKRFTAALLEIAITDIRVGSIIASYTVRYGTADRDVASELVRAIQELEKGTVLVYDGQTVNASSDSYNGMGPCEILYAIFESCEEEYTCSLENNTAVCSIQRDQSKVNWSLVIGLSAAGLFVIIVVALIAVSVRRLRRRQRKKNYSGRRGITGSTGTRTEDNRSVSNKGYGGQDEKGVFAGRFETSKSMLPRYMTPSSNISGSNQPYNISLAKSTGSSRSARENWH